MLAKARDMDARIKSKVGILGLRTKFLEEDVKELDIDSLDADINNVNLRMVTILASSNDIRADVLEMNIRNTEQVIINVTAFEAKATIYVNHVRAELKSTRQRISYAAATITQEQTQIAAAAALARHNIAADDTGGGGGAGFHGQAKRFQGNKDYCPSFQLSLESDLKKERQWLDSAKRFFFYWIRRSKRN